MKVIKALQDKWVDDRLYHAGDIVEGLTGDDLQDAIDNNEVRVVKAKKVKDGRKNSR